MRGRGGGIVEEVGGADVFVGGIVDYRGFKAVEREEVGDLLCGWVLH